MLQTENQRFPELGTLRAWTHVLLGNIDVEQGSPWVCSSSALGSVSLLGLTPSKWLAPRGG